jgi:TM2 domain-containing membrane protein YozV
VFALWLGVLLIFLSDAYSVLDSVDKSPADFFEKMYYTGFKLSTLGVGDFVAGRNGWRVLTALTAFMDLFTITLSISYLVPVISNAGQKRSLARYMRSLGNFPQDIVINSFNGQDFKGYESQFAELSTMIFSYTQNMLTYPILHHMHNTDPHENIVTRMCCLDEALNIFIFHLPKARRPSPQGLKVLRSAVTSYLRSVSYLEKEVQTPPLPQISAVSRESGIGLENQSPEQLNDFYQQLERRRRLWQANLQSDGWTWQDVEIAPEKQHLDLSTQKLAQYA